MNEIRVSSWSELQDALFADAWDPTIRRHRSRHALRGVNKLTYPLTTGLMRLGGPFAELEQHLLRNFKKYAHRALFEEQSIWHWLSLAQHHGLPTRLLDWTYSPLVALHFATNVMNLMSEDGAVWKVDYAKVHDLLPQEVLRPLSEAGAHIFTVDLLSESLEDLRALDRLSADKQDYAIFFEPPSIDESIVNQFAYFSVLSKSDLAMDAWLEFHPALWTKIIIPAELKWEVRDKLDQSNITERVLFPGLDGLTRWLKRHYTPRPEL